MDRTLARFVAVGAMLCLFLVQAAAVRHYPEPRLVCAEYFAEQAVVKATLLQTRAVTEPDDPEGIAAYIYTLKANELLQGNVPPIFEVYEGNDSGRATFGWKKRTEYLLFVSFDRTHKGWVLDSYGNSGPVHERHDAIQQVRRIRSDRTGYGVINGIVARRDSDNVRVQAKGKGRSFTTKTNSSGSFSLRVPAGSYRLVVSAPGKQFEPSDLTFDDPTALLIHSGGCAQVGFVEKDR